MGKKLGASAHAALVTRGFAEMMRFGAALGARRETLTGLSGLGDLVLTCGSPQSRNMSLGIELGKGKSLDQALNAADRHRRRLHRERRGGDGAARGIDMPIAQAVHAVISGLATVDEAIEALLARPLRAGRLDTFQRCREMKYNEVNWAKAWRGLAVTLLREGYCPVQDLWRWAKENEFPQRMISDVIEALAVEGFDHDGKSYLRLSGGVIPRVPETCAT